MGIIKQILTEKCMINIVIIIYVVKIRLNKGDSELSIKERALLSKSSTICSWEQEPLYP